MSDRVQEEFVEDEILDEEENEDGDESEDEREDDIEEEQPLERNSENFFSVWNRQSAGVKRLKVLLYGVAGTGKTTMAATFPSPLFLDMEGGLRSTLRVGDVFRYPENPDEDITSYAQVVDFYRRVKAAKNPPFQTIVLDSLNELQLLLAQHLISKYTKVKRQYDDQLTLADYGKTNRDFSKVIRLFLKLPYHVVFTAASSSREPGDEETLVAPKFVGRQVGPDVQRMMDMIGYCHSKMVNNVSQHYVSFHMTPQHLAKDRMGIVHRDIPNNFDAMVGSIKNQFVFEKGAK